MEPEVRNYLKRITWSIGLGFIYLMVNASIGIFGQWMFFNEKPTLGNYIFYAWFLLTTVGLIFVLRKWWRKKFPHG